MRYQWDEMLETGNQKIDNQHKQLFSVLNKLVDSYMEGGGERELDLTLEFLSGYVVKHFADEEEMMIQSKYPDYDTHRQYHKGFKETVAQLTDRLRQEGASEELVLEVGNIVADWLRNHIKGDDFRMAAYLQAHSS